VPGLSDGTALPNSRAISSSVMGSTRAVGAAGPPCEARVACFRKFVTGSANQRTSTWEVQRVAFFHPSR
jgi:hypothetical protein